MLVFLHTCILRRSHLDLAIHDHRVPTVRFLGREGPKTLKPYIPENPKFKTRNP